MLEITTAINKRIKHLEHSHFAALKMFNRSPKYCEYIIDSSHIFFSLFDSSLDEGP